MHKILALMTVASAALAGAPAVQACDLEGFGFARINPFGQHAAWNVPKDAPNQQQSENSAILSTPVREEANSSAVQDATTPVNAVQPFSVSATRAFVASQVPAAEQAKRFTATKD